MAHLPIRPQEAAAAAGDRVADVSLSHPSEAETSTASLPISEALLAGMAGLEPTHTHCCQASPGASAAAGVPGPPGGASGSEPPPRPWTVT